MSIQSDIREVGRLTAEITRLNKIVKQLRQQKTEAEKRIADFLETKNQPGVKFQGKAIYTQKKEVRQYKSQKDKERDCIALLEEKGIENPQEILKEVLDAMKGDKIESVKIKVSTIK
jgi:hypothetical protein